MRNFKKMVSAALVLGMAITSLSSAVSAEES